MPRRERRIPEKPRVYQGERDAKMLVHWLNDADDPEGKARIQEVIRLYVELWHLCHKDEACMWKKVGSDQWVTNESPESRRRAELESSLNGAFAYYQTRPWIITMPWFEFHGGQWRSVRYRAPQRFSPRPVEGSEFDQQTKKWRKKHPLTKVGDARKSLPGSEMTEIGAIRYTLELLESGYISNLRQCRCGKYIFQRFSHQRFCSQKCRIADYRSSEEFRVARNARQRELYRLHKKHNVK
jgi:hypothetical protein